MPTSQGFHFLETRITLENAHQYFDELFIQIEKYGTEKLEAFGSMLENQNVSGDLFQGIASVFAKRLIEHVETTPSTDGIGLFLHALTVSSTYEDGKTEAFLNAISAQHGISILQDSQKLFDKTWKEIKTEEDRRKPLSVMLSLNGAKNPLVKGYALSMLCHKIDNPEVEGAILKEVLFADSSDVKTEEDRQAVVQLATQWRLRSLDSWNKDKGNIRKVGIVLKEALSEELKTIQEEEREYEAKLEEIKTLRDDAYKITDSEARSEKLKAIAKQDAEAKLLEDAFFAHKDSLTCIIASVFKELHLETRVGNLIIDTIANPKNRFETPWDSIANLAYIEIIKTV
ncbi:hypothetical protein A2230_00190 [candidate division WOR-1 bacterium RIFOXYA2_FULL_36_21]|uniref:Uncharacterized protein n=1 Tax=candidate division WOR-1 bacterium RIFOXYB2_FULL_36_35 TaxID=1802578 RepID=A0A1F4S023_UNCSA|nr:MAG: hypothetical protein A2230_00190 [candidate division WOR-1 bacterium RIFOXYA2_FULL_36_21]OGC13749.1 MAG: hypothetical protein A2290_07740 [candidate division WOR-1 bacterium RIFOXYB2_FULL_36_35]OGC14472.1 MAG: hypothetical protein A2282_08740 [candidate division WOR-1 bacterium RIFOXYA12_FULL_36_13]